LNSLADKIFLFKKEDNKKQRIIEFQIEKPAEFLLIEFRYQPVIVERPADIEQAFSQRESSFLKAVYLKGEKTLKNMLTVSLYCEGQYLGCAHRHDNFQQIIISETTGTKGFLTGKIGPARWELLLSAHALYSEPVAVSIKISSD
jgi:hypothetical protein